ncbi:asparaginase (plasmid) [Agrobacterium sp. 33MFTa1.1]|uniref:asparaginase n=1 Tax=Agrobacterium sp. 33MFTa1.1 TaxID=1279031 RepID=UPI000552F31E|nr:asparaginase [Agrobacterium sp. 33MFTa1.1]QBJ16444.1 asparaginase [Agrobacterium sp. 33MFTa1.1]
MPKTKIAVIGLGGTIASLADHPLEILDYGASGSLECDALVDLFPELGELADILAVRFRAVPSFNIFYPDWKALLSLMEKIEAETPGLGGFVLLHGTGSMEETAFFLSQTVRTALPVVMTGAQRPPSARSSDAGLNLANAIRAATAPAARDQGVLILMNDELHAAREATKVSTLRLNAFQSPDSGPVGVVDGDAVTFYRQPLRRRAPHHRFDLSNVDMLPRVDIVYSYTGSDGTAARAFVEAGASGIVSAGFAPGYTADADAGVLAQAVREKGLVVVQASRGGAGRTFDSRRARQSGFIPADNLNPQKARLLLALALTRTRDTAEIADIFRIH